MRYKIAEWIADGELPKNLPPDIFNIYNEFRWNRINVDDDKSMILLLPVLKHKGFHCVLGTDTDEEGNLTGLWRFVIFPDIQEYATTIDRVIINAVIRLMESY